MAAYVGEVLVASREKVGDAARKNGISVQSTLIFGDQIAGERPGLHMIHPSGNCIATSPESRYLQVSESKYGKPILARIVRPQTTLEDAARCALVSLDWTMRSNLSVGMPINLVILRKDDRRVSQGLRLEADAPLYAEIHDSWSRKLEAAVHSLPRFPREPARKPWPAGVATAADASAVRAKPGDNGALETGNPHVRFASCRADHR